MNEVITKMKKPVLDKLRDELRSIYSHCKTTPDVLVGMTCIGACIR